MKTITVLCATLALTWMANAAEFSTLGYSDDTRIEPGSTGECPGELIFNHDYSFENGYAWHYSGTAPPYYGAFGESFDLGCAHINCAVYWFTQVGYYFGYPMDVYLWDGGVYGSPSGVINVLPDVGGLHIDYWPACTENDITFDNYVTDDFTIGFWADFSSGINTWWVCGDENGPGGHAWTNIAPGIGYPTGWYPVSLVWPGCISLGIGAFVSEDASPPESRTWGSIKALFE